MKNILQSLFAGNLVTKATKEISESINCDIAAAHSHAYYTSRLFDVPVSDEVFTSLVVCCFEMGMQKFKSSMLVQIINSGAEDEAIKSLISKTLNYYQGRP